MESKIEIKCKSQSQDKVDISLSKSDLINNSVPKSFDEIILGLGIKLNRQYLSLIVELELIY